MKQLDPRAVWLFFITTVARCLFLLIIVGLSAIGAIAESVKVQGEFSGVIVTLAVFIGFLGLMYLWARLSYKYYLYELTADGFRKESGVITKKYVTIPYDRIQNVDIYRGLLSRMLGLSDLHIQTAGASSAKVTAEGRLPGLAAADAEKMRDELIKRAKQGSRQGL